MKKITTTILTLQILAVAGGSSYAVNINPLTFDYDGSGKIDTPVEKEALIAWINNNVETEREAGNSINKSSDGLKDRSRYETKIRIRRNFEEISLLEGSDNLNGQLPKKGALFSYSSDILNNRQAYSAEGAIYVPIFRIPGRKERETIPTRQSSAVNFKSGALLGVSFNFLENGGSQRVNDDLNFYAGYQQFRLGGVLDTGILRISTRYETDFDFDSALLRADASWFPIIPSMRVNTRRNFGNGRFHSQLSLKLNGSVKQVVNVGNRMQLAKQKTYYGISVPIGVDFYINDGQLVDLDNPPKPLVHLYAKWMPAFGDLPSGSFEHLFNTGTELFLGGNTNQALTFDYKVGTVPFDGTRIEQFLAGLSVKF